MKQPLTSCVALILPSNSETFEVKIVHLKSNSMDESSVPFWATTIPHPYTSFEMSERICLIGFDESESSELQKACSQEMLAYEMLPRIKIEEGRLLVDAPDRSQFFPVSKVVFHGIFERDLDFLAAMVLWGGPCFPAPQGMLDCRLRLPGLVRALKFSRFAGAKRSYAGPGVAFQTTQECVAKWGNWHCGENKARFHDLWQSDEACLIEPFIEGEAFRIVVIGDQVWQIRMAGDGWLKSVHGKGAVFMKCDDDLVADTRNIQIGLGLSLIANDYMVASSGEKFLLEVNHIPSVTCFSELWVAYRDEVLKWIRGEK